MDKSEPNQAIDRLAPELHHSGPTGPHRDAVGGTVGTDRPSRVRTRLFRSLLAIVVLWLGGCLVAATITADGGPAATGGVADPDDYLVELRTCKADGPSPRATGLIRNNGDRIQGFRVRVEAIDGATGQVIAGRNHLAAGLQPGESEEFDLPIVDTRNVAADSVPEQLGCTVTVFYARS